MSIVSLFVLVSLDASIINWRISLGTILMSHQYMNKSFGVLTSQKIVITYSWGWFCIQSWAVVIKCSKLYVLFTFHDDHAPYNYHTLYGLALRCLAFPASIILLAILCIVFQEEAYLLRINKCTKLSRHGINTGWIECITMFSLKTVLCRVGQNVSHLLSKCIQAIINLSFFIADTFDAAFNSSSGLPFCTSTMSPKATAKMDSSVKLP